jgi:hypothetical protein
MIALGAGFGAGAGPEAAATFAGMLTAGNLLKRGSLQGTKEAVDQLRRTQYPNYPAFNPPVTPEIKGRTGNILRQLGLEYRQSPEDSPILPQYWNR